mgnify:CR=1 FL=1
MGPTGWTCLVMAGRPRPRAPRLKILCRIYRVVSNYCSRHIEAMASLGQPPLMTMMLLIGLNALFLAVLHYSPCTA